MGQQVEVAGAVVKRLIALCVLILLFLLVVPSDAAPKCEVRIHQGESIQGAIDKVPPGTTFCISKGRFTSDTPIYPKHHDRFIGEGEWATVIVGTGSAVFDGGENSGLHYGHLGITGATGDSSCKPMCGRGISQGGSVTVNRVRIFDNASMGIGGVKGKLGVYHSEIAWNGSTEFYGCCSGAIKSVNSLEVKYSRIHDNIGNGIWCDLSCTGFIAARNSVVGNSRKGIFAEVIPGWFSIHHNGVWGNNFNRQITAGGIVIWASRHGAVHHNRVGYNSIAGIRVNESSRGYAISEVAVYRNNVHWSNALRGCWLETVYCWGNEGDYAG